MVMKHVAPLLLALALVFTSAAFAEEEKESDVHTLTTENFDKFLKDNPVTLVKFYAPWCGHCKNLAPHYEEAATKLKKTGGIPLAKVDATAEATLGTRFEVRGYPTLKLFKNGVPWDYTGGRTADTIISWIESVTGPAVEDIEESAAKAPAKGVLFVARTKKDSKFFKLFEKLAEKHRLSSKFAVVYSDDAKDEVSALRPDEDPAKTKISEEEALDAWLQEERFPDFGPINGENYAAYEGRTQELAWFAGKEDEYKTHGKEIREAAKKFRADYSFVWLDAEQFGTHASDHLGLSTLPGLVIKMSAGGRYHYPEGKPFVAKDLTKFLEDVKSGKIEKFLKSEPIPENNDEHVKIVVGKNFDDVVFHKDKDVLLEVYAPWCGHCKRLEPIYADFAEKLSGHKHIIIAKMDGTANEPTSSDFSFRGFPTIFWVKAGADKPETYSGARTMEGLVAFVKENSSKPVDITIEKEEEEDEVKDEL